MSLTSYRAAPSRDTAYWVRGSHGGFCLRKAERPPRLVARKPSGRMSAPAPEANNKVNGLCPHLFHAPASMPGDDLLFQCLSNSTIGAVWFHGRVRDGIGWVTDAMVTKQ